MSVATVENILGKFEIMYVDPIKYPHYWQALNYKRVLDPESGFHVYPWELTPTWRDIKKVGRGTVSADAV